ncbi:MAG: hydrogen peroxide-dependent heme synthase [Burkholderiales bacterium]
MKRTSKIAPMARQKKRTAKNRAEIPPTPLALEGYAILHQMFAVRGHQWRDAGDDARRRAIEEAARRLVDMEGGEGGESALYSVVGHKADLMIVHFRRSLDELNEAERQIARLAVSDYLEQTTSYLSVIELGLYEASVALYERLASEGLEAHSAEWQRAVDAELAELRQKMTARIFPRIPERRYVCFYPMDKKRDGDDNWYRLPIAERRRLMQDHGAVGRRYAGQVTQIISGSVGLDDWEWGVDLFADDPLVFKKLVYEMRFDQASAAYAKFGKFYVGIRLAPANLRNLF